MIKIEGVSKSYGNGAPALSNLNLEIEDESLYLLLEPVVQESQHLSNCFLKS